MLSLSTSQSGFFTGYDNFPVFYKIWIPRGSPVARVLAFHGLGEHIGRYNHLFSHFADNGILVRAFDYRGHGNTFKKRSGQKSNVLGHARISDLCEDMIILETVNKQDDEAGIPLFYFGHSLGGLTALSFASKFHHLDNFSGVIASAPALRFTVPVPAYAKLALMATSIPLVARYTDENKLDLSGICTDKDVIEAYQADELVHERISLGLLSDIIDEEKYLFATAKDGFPHPVLICHSESDKLTDFGGSKDWIDIVGSKDKKFVPFKFTGHEIHNESRVQDEIFSLYTEWIIKRTEK